MILAVGSVNLDFTVRVARLPAPGETTLGGDTVTSPGGKGANAAVAAARAGGRVRFAGAVGTDAFGPGLRDNLRANGIDVGDLRDVEGPSGAAFILVDDAGENVIVVSSGANARYGEADLPDLAGATTVLTQLELPLGTVHAALARGRAAGARTVLNAAPARDLPADLLALVDVLVVNEGELRALGGEGEAAEVARALRGRGPRAVVVTLGGDGCLAVDENGEHRLPAFPVEVLDTVGAGDTFVGVLAAWLDGGRDLPEALRAANVAAALACTKPGAQGGMPTREEIDARL